jgi:hypothetical protein
MHPYDDANTIMASHLQFFNMKTNATQEHSWFEWQVLIKITNFNIHKEFDHGPNNISRSN